MRDGFCVAGFDMGSKYVAWSVLRYSAEFGWEPDRHGIIYPPSIGDTFDFGNNLGLWNTFFCHFVKEDLNVDAYGVERFTYRPGSQGQSSEAINLQLPGMRGLNSFLIRNTEWKSWFKRTVSKDGAEAFYGMSTPHECDASGIALYTGSVLLPKAITSGKS